MIADSNIRKSDRGTFFTTILYEENGNTIPGKIPSTKGEVLPFNQRISCWGHNKTKWHVEGK